MKMDNTFHHGPPEKQQPPVYQGGYVETPYRPAESVQDVSAARWTHSHGYDGHSFGFRCDFPPPAPAVGGFAAPYMAPPYGFDPSVPPPPVGCHFPSIVPHAPGNTYSSSPGPAFHPFNQHFRPGGPQQTNQYDFHPATESGQKQQQEYQGFSEGGAVFRHSSFPPVRDNGSSLGTTTHTQHKDEAALQRKQDEQWVKQFSLNRGKSSKSQQSQQTQQPSVSELRETLYSAAQLLSQLSQSCETLRLNLETDCLRHNNLETDCLRHNNLETDCLRHNNLETDCLRHNNLETDCPRHNNLETDCLRHNNLETDCLRHNNLETDCPRHNNLETDCPRHNNLETDCPRHNYLETDCSWTHSYLVALNVKAELQEKLKVLRDSECVSAFKAKLSRIAKRRARRLRARKLLEMEEKEREARMAEKEAAIDKWRMKQIHEVEEKKKEQELKLAADSVLCEVRKKQADVKRMQDILRSLEKLRKLRKEAASRKGIFTDQESDEAFGSQLEKLRSVMKKRTAVYSAEEKALMVMLEGEQEEERRRDLEKRLKKERERQLQRKHKVDSMLFGDEIPANPVLQPFREYYTQAERSLHSLVQIRREWDVFLVAADHPDGTVVPQNWVLPDAPSDQAWASALLSADTECDGL